MILKKKNPQASPQNALQIREIDGLCCGDVAKAIVCRYAVEVDTSSVTTASKISLGGVEFAFGLSIDLTTEKGVMMLVQKIRQALAEAGYTQDGIDYTITGNTLRLEAYYSQITFDYLEASANAFAKVDCKVVGNYKSQVCGADVTYAEEGGFFDITPVSLEQITNVKINDGTADQFDGVPNPIAGTPAGNVSSFNAKIYLSVAGLGYTGTVSFTVTITSKACEDIVLNFDYTFA